MNQQSRRARTSWGVWDKINLILIIALLFISAFAKAQDQFTNFGNVQVFTGAAVTFGGNFENNGTFTDAGLTVTLKGNSSQSISGTSTTTFFNLVVDAGASGITIQRDIVVSNSLALTSGPLDLNSKTLTINNSSPSALTRTGGYILSERTDNANKVKWNIGANTGSYIIPFGTAAGTYIPFTVEVTAGDIGNVTVSTYPTAANNTPLPTTPNTVTNVDRFGSDNSANVVDRFWQIDKDGPSGTATITFQATAAEVGSITNLRAQRWNTSTNSWDEPLAGQVGTATGVTVPNVTQFSPWTVTSESTILPLTLTKLNADCGNTGVEIRWTTATEVNTDHFSIERSVDGTQFQPIAKIDAAGNSSVTKNYGFIDAGLISEVGYYRLKQIDYDGKFTYSQVVKARCDVKEEVLTVFPNPASNQINCRIALDEKEVITIEVCDQAGTVLISEQYAAESGLNIPVTDISSLGRGFYIVRIVHEDKMSQVKFVKI